MYAEMAQRWRAAGRAVPGEHDAEWDRLLSPYRSWSPWFPALSPAPGRPNWVRVQI